MRNPLLAATLVALLDLRSAPAQLQWEVVSKPIVDIPGLAPDGSVQFEHPVAASRTSSGQVVVADAGSSSIRVFDASGRLLRSVGRTGRGPREFPRIAKAASCGDSLIVWDPSRTSVVGPTGEVARTVTIPNSKGPSMGPVFRCSSSLNVVYLPSGMSWVQRTAGMYVNRSVVVWADGNGRILWQSDSLPAGEWLFARPGGYSRPLGAALHMALVGTVLAIAPSDSARVWLFDRNGRREIVQLPTQSRRAPTKAEYLTATRLVADDAPAEWRENTEKNLLLYEPPAVHPAFYGMWGDSEGDLWIQTSAPGGSSTALTIIRPGRGVIGRVNIARDVRIQQIGKEHITALYDDDSDERHLAVFRLIRR